MQQGMGSIRDLISQNKNPKCQHKSGRTIIYTLQGINFQETVMAKI